MAAVVVFCTVYALILPAITLENGQNDIVEAANTESGADWGYNEDGSIWWNNALSMQQIADIEENTPYIIMGYQGNNLMSDEPFIKKVEESGSESYSYLKAVPKEDVADYASYQRWYFEKADTDNSYFIYYLGKDNSAKKYLRFAGPAAEEWGTIPRQLALTEEKSEAVAFTVKRVEDLSSEHSDEASKYPNHIVVSAEIEGNTYYVNSYYGDQPKSSAKTTHWWGYPDFSEGSFLQICKYESHKETAGRVETASSPNTVINLFDYWLSDNPDERFARDNIKANLNAGINKGHAFKFVRDKEIDEKMNLWTGNGENPLQGIVANTLDEEGYPVLSGEHQNANPGLKEQLQYLFDPDYEHIGKTSYRNVGGLLSIDAHGYYVYDSAAHSAEFDEDSNGFNVYDRSAPVKESGFFPFNKTPEIMNADRTDSKINHYFGMTVTSRFVQQYDGFTDENHGTPMTFEFSGDDDVWVFIDGVLVGDVGGIHDAASLEIDFSTGAVEVRVIGGSESKKLKTTLKDCYDKAGKYNPDEWTEVAVQDGKNFVYKNGTVHTLKFFYLERGNYSSHLMLKYNLTEIPKTAIYKVDQYGETVPGAVFAVYAADSSYNMLSDKGGSVVDLSGSYDYDDAGNIVENGSILARALYTGTTNSKGEMLFADRDGMPYSINELEEKFGGNFILREIKVPEGYRLVTRDVHLQIWRGENQKILKCDNTETSGTRAASNLQITATDTLYLTSSYNESNIVKYFNSQNNTVNGTLFAVVYRYVGKIGEDGTATELNNSEKWIPVYGSDQAGYTMVDMNGKSSVSGALEAAKNGQKYGDVVFQLSPSGTMQLTLKNLPGHITTYYRMLSESSKSESRYTAAYYWTSAGTLDEATEENTRRVYTFSEDVGVEYHYSGFERVFGADIQVPNLINKVFVQKVDEKNNPVNGARFAIYQVKQQTDGTIQYFSEDSKTYKSLNADAVIDKEGVITDTDGTFSVAPLQTAVTHKYDDGIHVGTAEFTNLPDGQYIIKEVAPPPGYKINTTDVMVLVTEDTIYANAGTVDDGVVVGRGPGYLVSPLTQFASEGQIDNTLTWIYAVMQISKPSTSFADVGDENKIKGFIKTNYTNETTETETEAFRTNLIFSSDEKSTAFNYVPDDKRNSGTDSDRYRRVFTTEGWNYYYIYQDYEYGKKITEEKGVNYEDWSGKNLMNLFSRSTYIRVMDEQETTLKVMKADAASRDVGLSGASFRLYKIADDGTGLKLYYSRNPESKKTEWTDDVTQALVVTTGEDGTAVEAFSGLKDGEFYLEEFEAPAGYYKPDGPVKLILREAKLTLDERPPGSQENAAIDEGKLDEYNLYAYTVTVYNYTGYELPATGGRGTLMYTAAGFTLMAMPLVYGYVKLRRKRKNE